LWWASSVIVVGTLHFFWCAWGVFVATWHLGNPAFILLSTCPLCDLLASWWAAGVYLLAMWRFDGHPVFSLVGTWHLIWSAHGILVATLHPCGQPAFLW